MAFFPVTPIIPAVGLLLRLLCVASLRATCRKESTGQCPWGEAVRLFSGGASLTQKERVDPRREDTVGQGHPGHLLFALGYLMGAVISHVYRGRSKFHG